MIMATTDCTGVCTHAFPVCISDDVMQGYTTGVSEGGVVTSAPGGYREAGISESQLPVSGHSGNQYMVWGSLSGLKLWSWISPPSWWPQISNTAWKKPLDLTEGQAQSRSALILSGVQYLFLRQPNYSQADSILPVNIDNLSVQWCMIWYTGFIEFTVNLWFENEGILSLLSDGCRYCPGLSCAVLCWSETDTDTRFDTRDY